MPIPSLPPFPQRLPTFASLPPSLRRLSLLSLHPPSISPFPPPSTPLSPLSLSLPHRIDQQSQLQLVTQDTHPLCNVTLHSLHKKAMAARPLASLTPLLPPLLSPPSPPSLSSRPFLLSPYRLGRLRGTERVRKGMRE